MHHPGCESSFPTFASSCICSALSSMVLQKGSWLYEVRTQSSFTVFLLTQFYLAIGKSVRPRLNETLSEASVNQTTKIPSRFSSPSLTYATRKCTDICISVHTPHLHADTTRNHKRFSVRRTACVCCRTLRPSHPTCSHAPSRPWRAVDSSSFCSRP